MYEALLARLPPGTVLGYDTAAAMFGFRRPAGPDEPIHVIVPATAAKPRIRGVVCHEAVLPVEEPIVLDGLPCAPAARCAVDLARRATRFGAIALLDTALRSQTCTPASLAEEVIKQTRSKSKIVRKKLPSDDPKQRRPDISLAKKELKWKPTTELEEGIGKTIAYFRKIAK